MRVSNLLNGDYSDSFNLVRDDQTIKSYAPKKGLRAFYADPYGEGDLLRIQSIDVDDGRAYVVAFSPIDSLEVALDEELEVSISSNLKQI